jgi:hypothetical protein
VEAQVHQKAFCTAEYSGGPHIEAGSALCAFVLIDYVDFIHGTYNGVFGAAHRTILAPVHFSGLMGRLAVSCKTSAGHPFFSSM